MLNSPSRQTPRLSTQTRNHSIRQLAGAWSVTPGVRHAGREPWRAIAIPGYTLPLSQIHAKKKKITHPLITSMIGRGLVRASSFPQFGRQPLFSSPGGKKRETNRPFTNQWEKHVLALSDSSGQPGSPGSFTRPSCEKLPGRWEHHGGGCS